jgi:hypothetical protein
MGSMTGRGAGFCAGNSTPGFMNGAFGRRPRGGGRGWRHLFYATGLPFWARGRYATPTQDEEVSALKGEANWHKEQMDSINKRLQELEKS